MQKESIAALDLEIRNILGQGSFAEVYECFDKKDNQIYAVKMIGKQSLGSSKMKYFAKEAKILAEINHKNIVKFHSFHESQQCLLIKMSIIRGGTLKKLMEERKKARRPFDQIQIAIFLKNLLEGVRYLHAMNIIHRDLKPENILFDDSNDLSTVKIVDFGLSAKLQMAAPTNLKSQCGTLLYMAPQIFSKPSYTKSVDIWSISIITYMLFNDGKHPFFIPGMRVDDFKHKINNQNFPEIKDKLAQNFIERISKRQYQQRYNVNEALRHPFITRNRQDQIPLSIHESFKGFNSINEIITVMKLNITVNNLIEEKRIIIKEEYNIKVKSFTENNQKNRTGSPSRKKMRDKHNQFFDKMKLILNTSNMDSNQQNSIKAEEKQQFSPTLKKHQSFFVSLFEKQKPCELTKTKNFNKTINSSETNFKKIDNSLSFFNSFSQFEQKQSIQQKLIVQSQRIIMQQPNFKNKNYDLKHNLSKTVNFNSSSRNKNDFADQTEFKLIKLDMIHESPDTKRKIFQKKSLVEQPKAKYNPRLVKKYSFMNQKQKQDSQRFKNMPKFSLSTRINNKKTSPGKQIQKPMFNNFPKFTSYTQRK